VLNIQLSWYYSTQILNVPNRGTAKQESAASRLDSEHLQDFTNYMRLLRMIWEIRQAQESGLRSSF